MKILIVGGSGFLGRNLKNHLCRESYEVVISSRDIGTFSQLDPLTDRNESLNFLIREQFDVIINLAWATNDNGYTISENNTASLTWNLSLFELINEVGVPRFINFGTSMEIFAKNVVDDKDDFKRLDSRVYHEAKLLAFQAFCKIFSSGKTEVSWLRIHKAFGRWQHKRSLLPYLIECSRKKKDFSLKNPNTELDWISADDIALTVIRLLSLPHFPLLLEVGSSIGRTNLQVCNLVAKYFPFNINLSQSNSTRAYSLVANAELVLIPPDELRLTLEEYLRKLASLKPKLHI